MAAKIINNPTVPYLSPIEDGFNPGKMVRIQGRTTPNCDRFNINLQCGGNIEPRDDIALHASIRVAEGYIARNTLINQQWGEEQNQGQNTIGPGQQFEFLILCEPTGLKIAVNGQHFCDFPHRVQFQRISHLAIDGEVELTLISHEFLPPPPQVPQQGAPPMHGAPMHGPPQGPQYGPGPQGYYGPPPPPPGSGEDKSSGLESFLGEAGVTIAGMIGQQAIQKLAGSQNANQSAQPNPASQNPLAGGYGGQSVGGLGSIGSILSGVLSEAATKNQGTYPFPPGHPQHGQDQQTAGLIALGSILSNVLSESNKNQYGPNNPPPPQHQQGYQGNQGDQGGFGGALGSILGNVLSDAAQGGQRQQPPPPPPPQQQPQGGGDLGGLLGSLASSFFSPQQPRK